MTITASKSPTVLPWSRFLPAHLEFVLQSNWWILQTKQSMLFFFRSASRTRVWCPKDFDAILGRKCCARSVHAACITKNGCMSVVYSMYWVYPGTTLYREQTWYHWRNTWGERDTLSEAAVSLRAMFTFVTWSSSGTEFLVKKLFYKVLFVDVLLKRLGRREKVVALFT